MKISLNYYMKNVKEYIYEYINIELNMVSLAMFVNNQCVDCNMECILSLMLMK